MVQDVSRGITVVEEDVQSKLDTGISYYFIELPKFRIANPDMNDKLNQWLAFIDDRNRGWIKMAKEKNETIKDAEKELEYLTGDEEVKRMAFLKEKWERGCPEIGIPASKISVRNHWYFCM